MIWTWGFNLVRIAGKTVSCSNDDSNFTAFIEVDDVDAVHAQVMENGAKAESEPNNQLWGGRVFTMYDLNGFKLTFWQLVEKVSLEEVRQRNQEPLRQEP